ALVPSLDCGATIGKVVRGARRHLADVVVVDDGSSDGTVRAARRAGAEVLRHGENRGKGVALVTGLRHLAARRFSHALTLDGDGQHLPAEMPALLAESAAHPEAIVIGARRIESEVAWLNRFGNEFADLWVRIVTGRHVADTQSGFRVYPIDATLALGAAGRRFDFETEVVIRAIRAGIDVRSVSVRVHYPPPEERVSHYDKLWDTVRIVQMVVGLMLRVR
ncbi:MAG: glycosyltransferase family 2 protein, partial [Candidatus Binatia bacterium]